MVYVPTFGWFLWFSCRQIYNRPMDSMGNCKGPIIKQPRISAWKVSGPPFVSGVGSQLSRWSKATRAKWHEPWNTGWLVGWFGLVWFGLVWFGLVWFGLVWFGWLVGWLVSLWHDPCSLVMASEIIPNKNWVGISSLSPLSGKQHGFWSLLSCIL